MQFQSPIKGRSFNVRYSLCILISVEMELVIDFEHLSGRLNEIVVKEGSVAGKNVSDSFRFEPPYLLNGASRLRRERAELGRRKHRVS